MAEKAHGNTEIMLQTFSIEIRAVIVRGNVLF